MTASARWRGGPHATPESSPPCSAQAKPKKPGSRKRAAPGPRGLGRQKPRKRCEFLALEKENPLRVAFEKAEAKKKAEDAAELQAAVKALKAHDLYKKPTYQKILADVEAWVAKGGLRHDTSTHEKIAASRIRRLMGEDEGKKKMTPGQVRLLLRSQARESPDDE